MILLRFWIIQVITINPLFSESRFQPKFLFAPMMALPHNNFDLSCLMSLQPGAQSTGRYRSTSSL